MRHREPAPEAPEAAAPPTWPVPEGWPLYVSVERAAKLAGVSYEQMRAWVDREYMPIPHLRAGGRKRLVSVAAMPGWIQAQERR